VTEEDKQSWGGSLLFPRMVFPTHVGPAHKGQSEVKWRQATTFQSGLLLAYLCRGHKLKFVGQSEEKRPHGVREKGVTWLHHKSGKWVSGGFLFRYRRWPLLILFILFLCREKPLIRAR
jgi:hypothetical protein